MLSPMGFRTTPTSLHARRRGTGGFSAFMVLGQWANTMHRFAPPNRGEVLFAMYQGEN
jgi:hypothetical protein